MSRPGAPCGLAAAALVAALAGACAPRAAAPGRYGQAAAALGGGRSAEHFSAVIALAHTDPKSRAGRRARAILCGSSGPLDALAVRAQAPSAAPPAAEAEGAAAEAPEVLAELAALQARYHAAHGRFCRDFSECPLTLPPAPHYFYFLGDEAVVGGSDSQATVEAEADIRAWMRQQHLRPHVGRNRYLAVAVGLASSQRVDAWLLDQRGVPRRLGAPGRAN